jgi:diaminopimelate epimerase
MKYEGVIADPAGNITLFVLSPVRDRPALVRSVLEDPRLKVEQVGFVLPRPGGELPRLEMMGGEFCGNAARSFGLLCARERGLSGKGELRIGISGMGEPLPVRFDLGGGSASVEIPPPQAKRELPFRGRALGVYDFEGISHVIAPELPPSRELFGEIRGLFEEDSRRQGFPLPGALGIMFWNGASRCMSPAVYVYGPDSLVFESSCGSGTAALGLYLGEELREGRERYFIVQRGGLIEAILEKEGGRVRSLSIGGPVSLSEPLLLEF